METRCNALSKILYSLLSTSKVQPRLTEICRNMTEKIVDNDNSIQTNKINS